MQTLYRKKEEFLKHLDSFMGYSSHTIISYESSIDSMLCGAKIAKNSSGYEIDLMDFRVSISHLKPRSIAQKLSAVRSFIEYLRDRDISIKLRSDDSIKTPQTLPKPITHNQVLEAISHSDDELLRLSIVMLYTMGLRISELVNIKISDISGKWIRVYGKGKKERDIPLLDETKSLIDKHIEKNEPNIYLFEEKSKKLSENRLRYLITKLFASVGLRVTPHQLRHTYATELLNNGARIADVSELLGHSSMATTQVYTKLSNSLKLEQYMNSHPLCSEDNRC